MGNTRRAIATDLLGTAIKWGCRNAARKVRDSRRIQTAGRVAKLTYAQLVRRRREHLARVRAPVQRYVV